MGTCAKLAQRALKTENPVIVQIQGLIREAAEDVISLAQGVVYWQPPEQALNKVKEMVWEPSTSRYGADEGLPELREALVEKIAYPTEVNDLGLLLLKVQDNIPICASIIGQRLALYSLEVGPQWVKERVQHLVKNREVLIKSLASLGEDAVKGGEGAIYLWARLPKKNLR